MCLDRETMRAGELRTASCPASSPPQVLSAELKLRRDFCSQDLPHSELPSLLSTAAQARSSSTRRQGGAGPAWAESELCLARVPSSFAPLIPPGTTGCPSTMWQLNSLVAYQLLCASAPPHYGGAGRDPQRAGIPFLAGFCTAGLASCNSFLSISCFAWNQSTICKGGGRASSWSCLYHPSTLLPYCYIFPPQELI